MAFKNNWNDGMAENKRYFVYGNHLPRKVMEFSIFKIVQKSKKSRNFFFFLFAFTVELL